MATTTDTSRKVAAAVSAALNAADISTLAAAEKTGIPRSTLARRLTGNSPFLFTELELLAGLIGVTVNDLIATAQDAA